MKMPITSAKKMKMPITSAYYVDKSIIHQKERKPILHVDPTEYL